VAQEKRYNAHGKYKNGNEGVNLLMAILGDERVGQSFSFHRCLMKGGTDQLCFYDFMLKLCNWLVANHPGCEFMIRMDNLNICKHPIIIHLIYSHGHCVVF
jgi:hypothetical protein